MKKIDFSQPARRKRSVVWLIAGGWTTNAILIVQGFLLIPLYLHFLGERLYGFWLATGGLLAWLSMADLGASAVTLQRCAAAYGRKDFSTVASYFWHGLCVLAVVVVVVIAGMAYISRHMLSWLVIDPEYHSIIRTCFMIAGLGVVLRLCNDFFGNFAIALQRSQIPVAARAIGDILGLVTIVVTLTLLDFGLYALVSGVIVRGGITFVANLFNTLWILYSLGEGVSWSNATLMDYVKTTPSVLAAKSSSQFARNLPPVLLARFVGPEATVAYNISLRVLQVAQGFVNQALSGIYSACSHFFFDEAVSREKERETLKRMIRGFIVSCFVFGTGFAFLNQGFVSLWTSDAQFAGQLFTSGSALACFFFLRGNLYVGLGMAMGKINSFELTQTFESVLQAVALCFAIEAWGIHAVPFAIIFSLLVSEPIYHYLLRRVRPVVGESLQVLRWIWVPMAMVFVLAYYTAGFFHHDSWWPFLFKSLLVGVPIATVFFFGMPGLAPRVIERAGSLLGKTRLAGKNLKYGKFGTTSGG
ncbi:MATE family efflux transporter [Coraliomargarita parva]|uniref:MATE family efflux transporter n=1 Tax=Coraliomargarita parva TaxID=3014050 RepID=UPI0022B5584C|nr:MATE family efflux transporter [Coraliomargarita parva]